MRDLYLNYNEQEYYELRAQIYTYILNLNPRNCPWLCSFLCYTPLKLKFNRQLIVPKCTLTKKINNQSWKVALIYLNQLLLRHTEKDRDPVPPSSRGTACLEADLHGPSRIQRPKAGPNLDLKIKTSQKKSKKFPRVLYVTLCIVVNCRFFWITGLWFNSFLSWKHRKFS